jgi:hypothetical protein
MSAASSEAVRVQMDIAALRNGEGMGMAKAAR